MALRDEVELDVASALRGIDKLGASLEQNAAKFRHDLAQALDTLRVGPKVGTDSLDQAAKATAKVTNEQKQLRKATDESTAATGKYGRAMEGIAQIRVIQGLVAFFGGRALIGQIENTVKAASDLNEEVSRSQQVFGPASDQITRFGDNAVEKVALARGEAIRFANDFGTMFRGAGLADSAAAQMSKTFVQLGADIASFSNLPIEDALTKLTAGLSGEAEPLRRIGAGFTDLEVQAKAAQLGLRGTNGELSSGALIQARAAVILDKTRLAQGDLARTSGGLANQQRFLKAEAQQLREELGAKLTPAFLELTHELRGQLPAFGELASNLVPLLTSGLRALSPIAIALLNSFAALSPILTVIATILDAIPAPVLSVVVAFAALNSGIGPLPNTIRQFFTALVEGVQTNPAGKLAGIGDAFAAINPYAVGATLAVVAFTSILAAHRREQEKTKRAIKEATEAFLDQSKAVDVDARSLAEAAVKSRAGSFSSLNKVLGDDAINKFVGLVARGKAGYIEFINTVRSSSLSTQEQFRAISELGGAFQDLGNILQKSAQDALDTAVARGDLTQQQVDDAAKLNQFNDVAGTTMLKLNDAGTNWFATLSQLNPELAKAIANTEGLPGPVGDVTNSMTELDKALQAVKDSLDATFGRFLDAEEATLRLRSATHDLAAVLGEGAKKDESQVEFLDRVKNSTLDVITAVENRALAMARAGQIDANTASVQAEMASQIATLIQLFPTLSAQLQPYLDKLHGIAAVKSINTKVTLDTSQATQAAGGWLSFLNRFKHWGAQQGQQGGAAVDTGLAAGIDANLGEVADAGRRAGEIAAEKAAEQAKVTLRRSASSGLNLAGFLVSGIDIGAARRAQVDLHNFVNGMTAGLQGVVADAVKINPQEANDILEAVRAADQAAKDLADTRKELGANSIEAKIAELALADAQSKVNDEVAKALDSTEAYNKALEKVNDSIDTMVGSLRTLQSIREAQKAAREAEQDVTNEQARLGLFDRLITQQQQALAEATAKRQAAGGTSPSLEEQRIQQSIVDLQNRRGEQAGIVADAQGKLQDTQLDLIDSERKLLDLGGKVGDAQGVWEGFFRALATQAGLSQGAVDSLVASLTAAGQLAQTVRNGVLTGNPQQVNFAAPSIGTAAIGTATFQAASQKVIQNTFNIYETGDARATAVEVVDDIRAVELTG